MMSSDCVNRLFFGETTKVDKWENYWASKRSKNEFLIAFLVFKFLMVLAPNDFESF